MKIFDQDLTVELRRQLKPLGKQAEVARKASVIQSDVRDSRLRILADDHPFIKRLAGRDEQRGAVLQVAQGEGDDRPRFHRHQHPARAPFEIARPRPVLEKAVMDDPGATRAGHEL